MTVQQGQAVSASVTASAATGQAVQRAQQIIIAPSPRPSLAEEAVNAGVYVTTAPVSRATVPGLIDGIYD